MNLLDQFYLQHVQVSLLEGRLLSAVKNAGTREARVELKLAPRPMKTDSGEELPAYQVSAKLSCEGGSKEDTEAPHFVANVGIEAIYQQTEGEPVDISEFSSHHASLTRQLYPLLQQELRLLLIRLGLEQLRLPFDLPAKAEFQEGDTVRFSGALH